MREAKAPAPTVRVCDELQSLGVDTLAVTRQIAGLAPAPELVAGQGADVVAQFLKRPVG